MERRRLLAALAASSVALTGCLHDDAPEETEDEYVDDVDSDDDDVDDGVGDDGLHDEEEVPTGVSLVSTEFEVVDRVAGNAEDAADVEFDVAEEAVVVAGLIPGANSCKTADLESAGYDEDVDVLEVRVETVDLPDVEEVCTPVIMENSYRFEAAFTSGLPGTVSVYHDDELVVSVEEGSDS